MENIKKIGDQIMKEMNSRFKKEKSEFLKEAMSLCKQMECGITPIGWHAIKCYLEAGDYKAVVGIAQSLQNLQEAMAASDEKERKEKVKIVIFEGIDGCGKDTQIGMMANYLRSKNIPHCVIESISQGPVGKEIRRILSQPEMSKTEYLRLVHLFVAEQYNVVEGINKCLAKSPSKEGKVILINRSPVSTMAYALGYKENREDTDLINTLKGTLKNIFKEFVDLGSLYIVHMDIDPMQAIYRIAKRSEFDGLDTECTESFEYLQEVSKQYIEVYKFLDEYLAKITTEDDLYTGLKCKGETSRESIHNFLVSNLKLNDIRPSVRKRKSNVKTRK